MQTLFAPLKQDAKFRLDRRQLIELTGNGQQTC